MGRQRSALLLGLATLIAGAGVLGWRLRSDVDVALRSASGAVKPLRFAAVPARPVAAVVATSGDVDGVLETADGLTVAGGFGVAQEAGRRDVSAALPSRHISALASWRGNVVVAAEAGGVYLKRGSGWEELRTGFGTLHVRVLFEAAGGELLFGAREGLFRAAFGSGEMERLAAHPVRSIALEPGGAILSGGENGAYKTVARRTERLRTVDPWTQSILFVDGRIAVVGAQGLETVAAGATFTLDSAGSNLTQAVAVGGTILGLPGERSASLVRIEAGWAREEILPAVARKLIASDGAVFVDTEAGLYQRTPSGYRAVSPRPRSTPEGPFHVGALARFDGALAVGLFDGDLFLGREGPDGLALRRFADPSVWGVNALLPDGGGLYIASLRGASRLIGERIEALDGPGAAFSLASTKDGVAIGYGQGVRMGDRRLFSAFHGLPGNQALALVSSDALYVGTPSGLGSLRDHRVVESVAAGDGELPHPWVTALAEAPDGLHVATYGGGVARRAHGRGGASRLTAYPETATFKVNPGCLVEVDGALFLGTDDRGLYVRRRNGDRFEPVNVVLPSSRVTALLPGANVLTVGTDAGIARLDLEALK